MSAKSMRQSKALKNYKAACKRRQKALLDPRLGDTSRRYPEWHPGMRTAFYIHLFQRMQPGLTTLGFDHSHAH